MLYSFIMLAVVLTSALLATVWRHFRSKRRIVEWLHRQGCEVRVLKRAQVGRVEWNARNLCYYVEYAGRDNRTVRKLCVIPTDHTAAAVEENLFWRDPGPDDLLPGDWQCFECRARIPKGETKCPSCGWS